MLPPSDSMNHQNLKLAEFVASLHSQNRQVLPPPPPTYAAATAPASVEDCFADIIDDEDEDSASMASIAIKIDTSIDIEGRGNTIVIPTSVGALASAEHATSTPASTSHSSSPATGRNSPKQRFQLHRQVKSAQLASTIISALEASGILDDKDTGRQRPLEVNVRSGIRIRGDRNVVCAGVLRRVELSHAGSAGCFSEEKESSPPPPRWARKKRASSLPIDIPFPKKTQP
ncbi:hypothetical protein AJ78_03841 [Emergomyces pasteurianus Ep9510]|uniref:Uncharacterized protein n=1 Tax=Emergomyces pasteurianus Ep9510 TaxID=1447872 RepID=A0A1J9PHL9_9EURO|nr:hypothetical protein AJ78_03841 [Emergomyces pasteurianus Ep9510]